MLLVIIVVFILLYLYAAAVVRDRLSKYIIYTFLTLWFVALSLSTFNLYGLYPVSMETYLILLLNVSSFTCGFSLLKIRKKVYENKDRLVCNDVIRISYDKKFLLFVIIGIVFCAILLRKYYRELIYADNIRTLAMNVLREDLYDPSFVFYTFIAFPLFYALNAILAYLIIYNRDLKRIILFALYIIIFSFIGGGRIAFMVIIIALFFVLFMDKGIKISLGNVIGLILLSSFAYVVMSYLSAMRSGYVDFSLVTIKVGLNRLNEEFVLYITLPFRLLDYGLHNYVNEIGYLYGSASFDGINRYFRLLLRMFSIDIPSVHAEVSGMFQSSWILIGLDRTANYAYTNVIFHYLDFGLLGVFVIPFCFSLFFRWIIKMYYLKRSVASYCLMFYLFYVLINTVMTWHLSKIYSLGFIIIMTYFICREKSFIKI